MKKQSLSSVDKEKKAEERRLLTHQLLVAYKTQPKKELLDKLLEVNLGLIKSIVRKTCCGDAYFDDALQEAMINFCKAVELYDVDRGTPFSVYVAFYIRSAIYKWLNWNAQSIRVPRTSVSEKRFAVARHEFMQEHGRMPNREELAKWLGVPKSLLELREYAQRVRNVLSFDGMDDASLERLEVQTAYHEFIEGEEEPFTKEQKDILDQLTLVEREMLLERLYDGMLIRDIAKARGMKSHEAKRVIHGALAKCRKYAERLGVGSTGLSFEQEMEKLSEHRGRT
jgi:RNA polymerase sigma-B factor